MLGLVAAVPVITTGTACYEYHTTAVSTIRPDQTVHVVLSPEAAASLASTIGPNASSLDGRVMAVDSRVMKLNLTQIARSVGPEEFLKNEPIDVPVSGASSVTVRSFDRVRTFLVFGGLIASAIAAHAVTDQPGIAAIKGGPPGATK